MRSKRWRESSCLPADPRPLFPPASFMGSSQLHSQPLQHFEARLQLLERYELVGLVSLVDGTRTADHRRNAGLLEDPGFRAEGDGFGFFRSGQFGNDAPRLR